MLANLPEAYSAYSKGEAIRTLNEQFIQIKLTSGIVRDVRIHLKKIEKTISSSSMSSYFDQEEYDFLMAHPLSPNRKSLNQGEDRNKERNRHKGLTILFQKAARHDRLNFDKVKAMPGAFSYMIFPLCRRRCKKIGFGKEPPPERSLLPRGREAVCGKRRSLSEKRGLLLCTISSNYRRGSDAMRNTARELRKQNKENEKRMRQEMKLRPLNKKSASTILKQEWPYHLMLLAPVILVLVFSYIPMAGIIIAFEDFDPFKGMFGSRWVGLKNYRYILMLPDTMLFSGGLIPTYLVVFNTGLINTIWSLILPGAVPVYNVILMMNFFRSTPKALEEAARMDGAGQFKVLWNIYIPLAKPSLATVLLFSFVGHWNDWFSGLLYMQKTELYPLQSYLRTIIIQQSLMSQNNAVDLKELANVSDRTKNAAQIFIAMIPILIIYPLLQKHFAKGIIMGSVKE